ncbi:MAG: leucine-rich repeat protein [Clostridia bacterium]|jgi:hypothetical protein|nr:leucine-rich repeat protein [Clostridia bacterium]
MIKRFAFIMAAFVLAVFAAGCARHTHIVIESRRVGDYFCSIYEDGTVDITAYYGDAQELKLPDRIEASTVEGFGMKAFNSCGTVTAVYIPPTVRSLPAKLFDSCPNLRTVYIPRSVTVIGKNVIFNCPAFTTILYEGTEQEWKSINIGEVPWTDNYVLVNAEVIFEHKLG